MTQCTVKILEKSGLAKTDAFVRASFRVHVALRYSSVHIYRVSFRKSRHNGSLISAAFFINLAYQPTVPKKRLSSFRLFGSGYSEMGSTLSGSRTQKLLFFLLINKPTSTRVRNYFRSQNLCSSRVLVPIMMQSIYALTITPFTIFLFNYN